MKTTIDLQKSKTASDSLASHLATYYRQLAWVRSWS